MLEGQLLKIIKIIELARLLSTFGDSLVDHDAMTSNEKQFDESQKYFFLLLRSRSARQNSNHVKLIVQHFAISTSEKWPIKFQFAINFAFYDSN